MPTQRLNPAKLQKCLGALQPLIAAVHDARVRFPGCRTLRPGRLSGLSRYLKDLRSLPEGTDYAAFEHQLKRRLVRAQHGLYGMADIPGSANLALAARLPACYQPELERYGTAARVLLRALADVDIRATHVHQVSVAQTLRAQSLE